MSETMPTPAGEPMDRDGYTGPLPAGYPTCHPDGYGGHDCPTPTATYPAARPAVSPPVTHATTTAAPTPTSSVYHGLPVTSGATSALPYAVIGVLLLVAGVLGLVLDGRRDGGEHR